MTELSEIQVAMCKVFQEGGIMALDKVKKNSVDMFYTSSDKDIPLTGSGFMSELAPPSKWTIVLDDHTLTQEEYEAWVKKQ